MLNFFNSALKCIVKGFLTQPRGCLVQQMQLDTSTLKYRSRFSCLSGVWLSHTISHQFPNITQYPGDLLADSHFWVVHFRKIPHPGMHNSISNFLPESGWRPLCHLVLTPEMIIVSTDWIVFRSGFIIAWWFDIIPWWRHQMETFSAVLAICAGNSHKGQWRGALMFSLICVWIDGWVNNREAGDLRRHRAHYDVIVMMVFLTTR